MLHPCRQNPLLWAQKALKGLFSFNATPMAPLGKEVLVHMKLNCWRTWEFYTSKAWYLSHAAHHYRCIHVLMANTDGERTTDTFQFKHYALLVPEITATNRIIETTTRLTAAIAGIQEASPNKMEAIQCLCTLLLGKIALLPPLAASILPTPPVIAPTFDDKSVTIWNPQEVQTSLPPHKHATPDISPNSNTPAIIKDNTDDNTPTPVHNTHPSQHHYICLLQKCPLIRNHQLCHR
jgi:hypothetical protein